MRQIALGGYGVKQAVNCSDCWQRLKQRLEQLMMYSLTAREIVTLWIVVALLLLLAFWLMSTLGPIGTVFDLFLVPIMLAVFFQRNRGLVAIIPAFCLYCVALGHIQESPSLYVCLSSGFLEALEWFVLALVLIVALKSNEASRRYEEVFRRDMTMALKLQTALLPADFAGERVRLAGRVRQCREVGGDYYYFRHFSDHQVVFCLGDVMGKGIPSSMVTSIIMGFLHEYGRPSCSPAEVITHLNRRLVDLWGKGSFYFTTIFYAVYDEETQVLTYTTGGHHDAVLMHGDGKSALLRTDGGLVGAVDCLSWHDQEVKLMPGDRVVAFTDGVTEACDKNGKMFTLERAAKVIRKARSSDIRSLIDAVFEAVNTYTGGTLEDDISIVVMEVNKPE